MQKTTQAVLVSVALAIFLTSIYFISSGFRGFNSGVQKTEEISLNNVTKLSLEAGYDVQVIKGDRKIIKIEGSESGLKKLNIKEEDNLLSITSMPGAFFSWWGDYSTKITLEIPSIEEVNITGAGTVYLKDMPSNKNLKIKVNGAGEIKAEGIQAEMLIAAISGAADIKMSGSAITCNYEVSGAGSIQSDKLLCEDTEAKVSGAGSIKLHSKNTLNAKISGLGNIEYLGNPQVSQIVSGLGSVNKVSN